MSLPRVRGFDPDVLEHVLNLVTTRPRTKDELWNWCRVVLNVKIPRRQVCPGCCAPFDAFAEAYFAEEDTTVWWASRGSGKTFLLAALCLAELLTLHATINLLGGSGEQAKRVLAYLQGQDISAKGRFWDAQMPKQARGVYTAAENLSEVRTVVGSVMKALMASGTSVRGPHPARLRMDEVDEIKLKLFDAAMGQTLSQGEGWRIVPQQMVLSSTYQHPDGTMTEVLHRAKTQGWKVRKWCYREVLESNGGWLSDRDIEIKRKQTPAYMWDAEYENNEPSAEGRIWTTHEMDNLFLERLGEKRGDPMEQCVFHEPDPRFTFYHGGDWARDVDWSVFHTMRERRDGPDELAAWRRMGRTGWNLMADAFSDQVNAYRGRACHDETGYGKVVGDLLKCPAQGIDFSKRALVTDIFNQYVVAVQNQELIYPRIAWMETQHRRFTLEQLRNDEHRPDSVVAAALAWWAKQKAPRVLIGRPQPNGTRRH